MRLDVMIEGQEGVTWPQWQGLASACEQHGIGTLFRSDHYMNLDGQHPERGALGALGTVIALAAQTTTLRLGTMVSPATFRHPSVLAKLVTTADHVSAGRVELGLGAGWHEREHAAYGFTYPELRTRMEILDEQLQIVLGSWSAETFSFTGKHYRLEDLDAQPKPIQKPHPPLLMGGAAGPVAARLAARYADEYNTNFATVAAVRERSEKIVRASGRSSKQPSSCVNTSGRGRAGCCASTTLTTTSTSSSCWRRSWHRWSREPIARRSAPRLRAAAPRCAPS